jgi:hypothetical protein
MEPTLPVQMLEPGLVMYWFGAGAVVVIRDSTQVTGAVVTGPLWARSVSQITGRVIVGVAIKYTGP